MQCSFSVCLKTRDENQRAIDEFADQWRIRAADPAAGHPAHPFDCFYDASDSARVIPHKTYSRADVVHCMLWPSLVVIASAATFLYLEARRSRLTFCGRRPSDALAGGEKSQLKPAPSQHAAAGKVSKQHHEHAAVDDHHHHHHHHHGLRPAGEGASADPHGARARDGRQFGSGGGDRLNGQVRSSVDVRLAGTSPNAAAADGPTSRRARRSHDRPKSHSASSLAAGVDTGVLGRPASAEDGQRAADDESAVRRYMSGGGGHGDKFVGTLDSSTGRCVSESRLDAAV